MPDQNPSPAPPPDSGDVSGAPATEADDRGGGPEVKEEPAASAAVGGGGGQSFSELLAGAMASRPPPILTVPVVAVPCFLAPAALIESPGFAGQFAMTHQAVLATVTAQAQMQMQNAYSSSELITSAFSPTAVSTMSPVPLQQLPSPLQQLPSPVPEGSGSDVYHWRKYGQKQVKSSENSRSYYRCTDANCLAKKKVERCPDGSVVDVTYRGKHSHDPPKKYKYSREKGHQNSGALVEHGNLERSNSVLNADSLACKDEQNAASETPEQQLYCSSDCEVDAGTKNEVDVVEEPDAKRRLIESPKCSSTPVPKAVREYIVQTEIDARHLSDGYRWRKYGQKLVKGNPNPRSYYRCTHDGCPVRKHVEKASHDAKSLLITYEGKHNHDQPTSKYVSDSSPSTPKGAAAVAIEKSEASTLLLDNKPAVAIEKSDASTLLLDNKPSEVSHADALVEKVAAGEKPANLQDNKDLESAQAVISIGLKSSSHEDADSKSSDVKSPIFNESKAVVPVHNS